MRLLEVFLGAHILEKLAPIHIVHHEVDAARALKNVVHADDERVVDLQHYQTLQIYVLKRVFVDYDIFAHTLQRIIFLIGWQVDEEDFRESPPTNDRDHLELLKGRAIPLAAL